MFFVASRTLWPVFAFIMIVDQHATGERPPLDVAGTYDETKTSQCHCWNPRECDCVSQGCPYVKRLNFSSPDEGGFFDVTMGATDRTCKNTTEGPFQSSVDSAGFIIGGALWNTATHKIRNFNPKALEQDMNLVVMANVFGFNGNPAGYRSVMFFRTNITVCSTKSFLDGSCTPGQPRFVCSEYLMYCSGGKCLHDNLEALSPKEDAYFAQFSASALNGTYQLSTHDSSGDCPAEMSVYQFGSQLGFGPSRNEMHLARVVDTALAWDKPGKVQFQTQCQGLQWDMDMGVGGEFEQKDGRTLLKLFIMKPWHDEGRIEVEQCLFKKNSAERLYGTPCSHTTVTVLAVLFALASVAVCLCGGMLYQHREVRDTVNSYLAFGS